MAKKIAIANVKGGIGKTSTAIALADGLRLKHKKVLMIDGDPNSLSSTHVYRAVTSGEYTLADALLGGAKLSDCVQKTKYGDIIPCEEVLKNADTQIPADADRFYHLSDSAKEIEDMYDYVVIDCPPGDGVILGNVLSYVDGVVIPITCDSFGIQCLDSFGKITEVYKKRINPGLKIYGVLITMYEGRQSLTRDLEDGIIPKEISKLNTKLFKTRIRRSVKLKESQTLGVSLYDYAPRSTVAEDYSSFIRELLKEVK